MAPRKERVEVRVGDVWESTDPREKGRQVAVVGIVEGVMRYPRAVCKNLRLVPARPPTHIKVETMGMGRRWRLVNRAGEGEPLPAQLPGGGDMTMSCKRCGEPGDLVKGFYGHHSEGMYDVEEERDGYESAITNASIQAEGRRKRDADREQAVRDVLDNEGWHLVGPEDYLRLTAFLLAQLDAERAAWDDLAAAAKRVREGT